MYNMPYVIYIYIYLFIYVTIYIYMYIFVISYREHLFTLEKSDASGQLKIAV